jgi:hypothetical protein
MFLILLALYSKACQSFMKNEFLIIFLHKRQKPHNRLISSGHMLKINHGFNDWKNKKKLENEKTLIWKAEWKNWGQNSTVVISKM